MRRRLAIYGLLSIALIVVYVSVSGQREHNPDPIIYDYPSVAELEHDLGLCDGPRMSLNAKSVLVVDNSLGTWIYSKRPMNRRPIASLTKLLTAMVYLDTKPDLDTTVYISGRDCYQSAKSHVYKGEGYRAKDLLYAAVMASDNRAARALATASGMPREIFIEAMNKKARSLGMMNTEVVEVTGLDECNISTAADIAILISEAAKYPIIREISSTYTYRCRLQNKKRNKNFINTNRLVRSRWNVLAGKTGFIIESDYCLATILRNREGKEITVVVLGSPTNSTRFAVARKLAQYGFKKAGRCENGAEQIAGR